MKKRRIALLSFLITLGVWLLIAWPLPRMMDRAISVGVMKRADNHIVKVHMMPGDHLQFVYYMWIFSDYLSGRTPFFYNLYEFNEGDDTARFRPGSYYFPFSLAFSLAYWFTGIATAWNLISLGALWLAFAGCWMLARRYTSSHAVAACAALVSLLFPYQWIQLYGGSPAGFGMALIPWLLYGIDTGVRDRRASGGWIAGLSLLSISMTDNHAFFFGTLVAPCWALVAFARRDAFAWKDAREYLGLLKALWPIPALFVLAYLQTQLGTSHIRQSHAAGGRKVQEVALFAPRAEGLWAWKELDPSYHIYFGFLVAALLAIGLIAYLLRAIRQRRAAATRDAIIVSLLLLGITGVVLLSMGPFSPFEGRLFTAARNYVPNYTMIRQTAKIFVLLPALLSVGLALTLSLAWTAWPRKRAIALLCAVAALMTAEYYRQSKLLISTIDASNDAYAAAAEDATSRDALPRAIILPLWPGDSHFTSVYQYYAAIHRIRMINGYRPFVPQAYIDGVFLPFRDFNLGVATDDELDLLLAKGIEHIIVHEDLFPEKVSPFPVGATLRGLLEHPRIRLLAHDGPVWSFRVLAEPSADAVTALPISQFFPARRFEAEKEDLDAASTHQDPSASAGAHATLPPGGLVTVRNKLLTPALPGIRWIARVRGNGNLVARSFVHDIETVAITTSVAGADWTWIDIPAGIASNSAPAYAQVKCLAGSIDVDVIKPAAGDWPALAPGESIDIPAAAMFHAGTLDLETLAVTFDRERDRRDFILYGPKLPVEPGRYAVETHFTAATPGARIGRLILAVPDGNEIARVELEGPSPARVEVAIPSNLPLLAAFLYDGEPNASIQRLTLTRLP